MEISLQRLTRFFGICTLLAFGFLMFWLLIYLAAGEFAYSVHARLFSIDHPLFERTNYCGMALFKMLAFALFLIPWIALKIIARGQR